MTIARCRGKGPAPCRTRGEAKLTIKHEHKRVGRAREDGLGFGMLRTGCAAEDDIALFDPMEDFSGSVFYIVPKSEGLQNEKPARD